MAATGGIDDEPHRDGKMRSKRIVSMLTKLIARSEFVGEDSPRYNADVEYEYRCAEYEHDTVAEPEAYAEADWDRVQDLAEGLLHWLSRGGFPPRATTGSELGREWDRAIALVACRFAQAKAQTEVADVSQ